MVAAAVRGTVSASAASATLLHETAVSMTRTVGADRTICDQLIQFLVACGRLSMDSGDAKPLPVVGAAMVRFLAVMEGGICAALAHSIADDEQHHERIRRFFLRPQETYSVEELGTLWGIRPDDVRDIYHDELMRAAASTEEGAGVRIAWADAIATSVTFNILRPFDVERALGAEFSQARPAAWRTVPVLVQVPIFIVEAIAAEHSIPPKLPVNIRLEQIIVEVFASAEHPIWTSGHESPPMAAR